MALLVLTTVLTLLTPPAQPLEFVPAPTPAEKLAAERETALWVKWAPIADCESGEWNRHGRPIPGSARWNLAPYEVWHASHFQGGVQFHPKTWDWLAPEVLGPDAPADAHLATVLEQIAVAERTLELQGWGAWPVCSRKVGYR